MKIAFHGTSADAFAQIVKDGFVKGHTKKLWNESLNCVYLWLCDYEEDEEERLTDCKLSAMGNAELALLDATNCRRVVLEIDVEGLDYVEDSSCNNMEGAIECQEDIPLGRIKKVWIDENDLSLFKLEMVSGFLKNPLFNHYNFGCIRDMSDSMIKYLRDLKLEVYWRDDFELVELKDYELLHVVVNGGGKHGTPYVVNEDNFIS